MEGPAEAPDKLKRKTTGGLQKNILIDTATRAQRESAESIALNQKNHRCFNRREFKTLYRCIKPLFWMRYFTIYSVDVSVTTTSWCELDICTNFLLLFQWAFTPVSRTPGGQTNSRARGGGGLTNPP